VAAQCCNCEIVTIRTKSDIVLLTPQRGIGKFNPSTKAMTPSPPAPQSWEKPSTAARSTASVGMGSGGFLHFNAPVAGLFGNQI
jgi:hypothetical protein